MAKFFYCRPAGRTLSRKPLCPHISCPFRLRMAYVVVRLNFKLIKNKLCRFGSRSIKLFFTKQTLLKIRWWSPAFSVSMPSLKHSIPLSNSHNPHPNKHRHTLHASKVRSRQLHLLAAKCKNSSTNKYFSSLTFIILCSQKRRLLSREECLRWVSKNFSFDGLLLFWRKVEKQVPFKRTAPKELNKFHFSTQITDLIFLNCTIKLALGVIEFNRHISSQEIISL